MRINSSCLDIVYLLDDCEERKYENIEQYRHAVISIEKKSFIA